MDRSVFYCGTAGLDRPEIVWANLWETAIAPCAEARAACAPGRVSHAWDDLHRSQKTWARPDPLSPENPPPGCARGQCPTVPGPLGVVRSPTCGPTVRPLWRRVRHPQASRSWKTASPSASCALCRSVLAHGRLTAAAVASRGRLHWRQQQQPPAPSLCQLKHEATWAAR